jgi:Tol biopolymer transport system component
MRRRWSSILIASTLWVVSSILLHLPSAFADLEPPQGRIAYVTTVNGHMAIFVIDPANYDNRSLVDLGDRDASQPAWAFDGARIAFTAETSAGGPTAIFVANADGSGVEQVTSPASGESDSDASWSPAGDEIAFARTLPTGVSRILVVDVDALTLRALDFPSLPSAAEPDWSPEGSRITFVAKRYIGSPTCDTDPQLCRWNTYVANADGSGQPQQVGGSEFDRHDPDWSADATRIATTIGLDPEPPFVIGVVNPVSTDEWPLPGTDGLSQPSWSPYRHGLVASLGSGSQSIIVIYSEVLGEMTFLIGSASQPAWGPVPDVPPIPPPPFETSPPTIEFSAVTNDQGWLTDPFVGVVARDQTSVSITCHLDDSFIPIDIASRSPVEIRGSVALGAAAEGQHVLRCWAVDGWNNQSSDAIALSIDFTAPTLGQASFSPHLIRIDQTAILTLPFEEHGSGLSSATVRLEASAEGPSFPMIASGSTLTAAIGPSVPAGIWSPVVRAIDNNGNASSRNYAGEHLVVYDPQAGSASGTGWIIPGGATSDTFDYLSGGLDGKTKASFSFKAEYESAASTSPAGFFNLSYGNQFKLQSGGLDWLLVSTATAEFQGTATIKGLPGTFVFQVTVRARGSTYPADRLELRVWPTGADPFRDPPQFQATGDAGGKIQIQGRDA